MTAPARSPQPDRQGFAVVGPAVGPVVAFAAWTLFVWGSRIRNIWVDDALSTAGQVGRTAVSVVFCTLAILAAATVWRARTRGLAAHEHRFLQGVAVVTMGYWAVRVTQIVLADHDAGFTAVHVVLGVVFWALSLAVLTKLAPRSALAASGQ